MPLATVRYMRQLRAIESRYARRFAPELTRQFRKVASDVVRAFEAVVVPELDESAGATPGETKAIDPASIPDWVRRIMNSAAVETSSRRAFERGFEQHYRRTGEATFEAANARIGTAIKFGTDPAGTRVVAEGGRRAGLVDLSKDTRQAIFRALSEGREAGEGAQALARRIRQQVQIGRFTGIAETRGEAAALRYRSELIARTETKYAQNVSTVEHYAAAGVTQVRIVDAQLGASDAECEDLNGLVVDMSEAQQFVAQEHPNGTRSFDPVFE